MAENIPARRNGGLTRKPTKAGLSRLRGGDAEDLAEGFDAPRAEGDQARTGFAAGPAEGVEAVEQGRAKGARQVSPADAPVEATLAERPARTAEPGHVEAERLHEGPARRRERERLAVFRNEAAGREVLQHADR